MSGSSQDKYTMYIPRKFPAISLLRHTYALAKSEIVPGTAGTDTFPEVISQPFSPAAGILPRQMSQSGGIVPGH